MTKRSPSPRSTRDMRTRPAPLSTGSPPFSSTFFSSPTFFSSSPSSYASPSPKKMTYLMSSLDGVCAFYIDTKEQFQVAMDCIYNTGSTVVSLDLEGVHLSKSGLVSLLHLYDGKNTYIFDVMAIGNIMFSEGFLRDMLTSDVVTKVMFDCRKDCEALFHQYQIALDNVVDVQMAEIVYRYKLTGCVPRHYIGLTSAVEQYNIVKSEHMESYSLARTAALNLYCPSRGGRIEVWGERPLNKDLLVYCAEDIKCIYRLYTKVFAKRLSFETCIGVSLLRLREAMTTTPTDNTIQNSTDTAPHHITNHNTNNNEGGGITPLSLSPRTKCFVNFDVALYSKFEDSMQQYKRMGFMKMCVQKC